MGEWFGGGFDLTPYFPFREDCTLWHQHAKAACDSANDSYYEKFKKNCDDYFYLPHRKEHRGIGGIFWAAEVFRLQGRVKFFSKSSQCIHKAISRSLKKETA